VVKEIIQYYLNNGSVPYLMLLDASKAFDRVHYIKLFRLLVSRGICPLVARLLCVMYTNQIIKIKWGDYITHGFTASNGVKQGGVLSPILFGVYIDELLKYLSKSGVGCYIGHEFMGAFGYADDITLLAPTKYALNRMFDITNAFSYEFDVKFNPVKSKLYSIEESVLFDNVKVSVSSQETHLGNVIGPNTSYDHVNKTVCDFYKRVNLTFFMSVQ
jgi:hypothetical protein